MSFLYCLNTSTIKPTPVLRKIALAARHGYRAIELWINEVYEHVGRGGEVSEITRSLADHGMVVPCTIALRGWGDASDAEYPIQLEEARRRMELAVRLGAPFIVATPPREPTDLQQLTRRYRDLLELGRQIGIRPTMEYLGFVRSVFKLTQAWQIVQDSGAEQATLVVDAFHNFRGGSTPDDLRRVPVERISHYHLNDAPADKPRLEQADPDRVMPGDGILDLGTELAILKEKGYRGAISLELFNRDLWARDPDEVVKLAMERMRSLLE